MPEKSVRLNDILPTAKINAAPNKESLEKLQKAALALGDAGGSQSEVKSLAERHQAERVKALGYAVPKGLRDGISYGHYNSSTALVSDHITKAFDSPCISRTLLLQIVDVANLAIIPFGCLREDFLQGAPSDYRDFAKLPVPIWVVAPVTGFSLELYTGGRYAGPDPILPGPMGALFLMSLMMFRHLQLQIRNLDNRVTVLESSVAGLQRQVANLAHRLDAWELRAAEERATAIARASEFKERSFRIADPLMLAGDMDKTENLVMGPCWGPPLSPELVKILLAPVLEK